VDGGVALLRNFPTPMTWPPVPHAGDKGLRAGLATETICDQISGCRWFLRGIRHSRVGELPGAKRLCGTLPASSQQADAAEESPLRGDDGHDFGAVAANQYARALLAPIQSGMKILTGWPRMRPSAAKEMPVLPLVASAMVKPGSIFPSS